MSEWISVEDRLPEPEELVLVYAYNDWNTSHHVFLDRRRDFFGNIIWIYAKKPTHWMPLPPPPEDK